MKLYLLVRQLSFFILVLQVGALAGCSWKPLVSVSTHKIPQFSDDLDRASLKQAVQRSLDYLRGQPQRKTFPVADQTCPISRLTRSLEFFLNLLDANPSAAELNKQIRLYFDVFQASGGMGFNPGHTMLVTGYYQPVFDGSLIKKEPFLFPLYSVPPDLVQRSPNGHKKSTGRIENGRFVPYWDRRDIELRHTAAGHELVWLRDPFDAFILHVQGSGLIRLRDGSLRAVHYAAGNGRPYRSIGKYLVTTKRLKLKEANLASIRNYIAGHPRERNEILYHNPSFIFFQWTKTHGAIGNLESELTAGRSIAVDQSCFPAGALAFLMTRRPVIAKGQTEDRTPLNRFVLAQDSGSAIRGPGRVDLFWGTGAESGLQAGQMKEPGTLFFLLLKEKSLPPARQGG